MRVPNHIAIILDGNGRWAKKRGMPRSFGLQAEGHRFEPYWSHTIKNMAG